MDPTKFPEENYDGWGDIPLVNTINTFRFLAGNINGFSLDKTTNSKLQEILTNIKALEVSTFMFQEINTAFKQREA